MRGARHHGAGASFAKDAHKVFNFNFKNAYCPGTPAPYVTYEALGSGAGRHSMKVRNRTPRFGSPTSRRPRIKSRR